MKRIPAAILSLLLLAVSGVAQKPKHRIVVEMSLAGVDAWKHAMGDINDLRSAFKDDVQIEVVFLGDALAALQKTDTELQAALNKAAESGIVLAACQSSMRTRNVTSQDLFPFAAEVPSGLAEVVLRQEEGYSYVKLSFEPPKK